MDSDQLPNFFGFTGIAAVVAQTTFALFCLLVLTLIIRIGVRVALRDHQLWMEKTGRSDAGKPFPAITPPPRQF